MKKDIKSLTQEWERLYAKAEAMERAFEEARGNIEADMEIERS